MSDEKSFTVLVTVKKTPENEVEDDGWFDPADFVDFLNERYVVDRDADYGLDGYNKHAGQLVVGIEIARNRSILRRNKHSDDMYPARTDSDFDASCRKIIRELVYTYRYIYEPDPVQSMWGYRNLDHELLALTDEEIKGLPDVLVETVRQERNKFRRLTGIHDAERTQFDQAVALAAGEAVTDVDGREVTPWMFLQNRNGNEYEDFEIVTAH